MSFFDEIFQELNINNSDKNITISMALGGGIFIVGNFKILSFSDSKICINSQKETVIISGENLSIKTMAKGEILASGKICNVEVFYKK